MITYLRGRLSDAADSMLWAINDCLPLVVLLTPILCLLFAVDACLLLMEKLLKGWVKP